MTDQDIIKKLQTIRAIKPNSHWAVSARSEIVNYAETGRSSHDYGLMHALSFSYAKLSAGFAFAIVTIMITSTVMAQNSLPGSFLYGVKIAFEGATTVIVPGDGLEIRFAERRVDEVSELAISKLESEEAEAVLEKVDNYRRDIASARQDGDSVAIQTKVNAIEKQTRVLTAAISKTDAGAFADNLRELISKRMESCENEKIAVEISGLLKSGDVASLIEANELSARCGG